MSFEKINLFSGNKNSDVWNEFINIFFTSIIASNLYMYTEAYSCSSFNKGNDFPFNTYSRYFFVLQI